VSSDSGASVADEWLQIARKDWRRAERNLKDRDSEAAGFFLQQSLEKLPQGLSHKAQLESSKDSRTRRAAGRSLQIPARVRDVQRSMRAGLGLLFCRALSAAERPRAFIGRHQKGPQGSTKVCEVNVSWREISAPEEVAVIAIRAAGGTARARQAHLYLEKTASRGAKP
jgi:hypothetical protein